VVIRRKLTLKRIDPWSVLKFGFVVNVALMLIVLLGLFVLWLVIQQLGLIERACDAAGTLLELDECGLNSGPLFRTLLFLGLLGVVIQTGIMVLGAFLYNLIADLTGGLAFSYLDESGDVQLTAANAAVTSTSTSPARSARVAGAVGSLRGSVSRATEGVKASARARADGDRGSGGSGDASTRDRGTSSGTRQRVAAATTRAADKVTRRPGGSDRQGGSTATGSSGTGTSQSTTSGAGSSRTTTKPKPESPRATEPKPKAKPKATRPRPATDGERIFSQRDSSGDNR
jgi:hypothetical protein